MEITKMYNKKRLLSLFLMLFCACSFFNAYAAQDPVVMLQGVANNMIAGLQANKASLRSKPQTVFSLAYRYVVPHADLDLMSKRVLPPQVWNSASASQRDEFKREFTRTLIRTYASALSSYQDQVVKFYPIRGASGNTVQVNSVIQSPESQPIRVSYLLINTGGAWRLLDMSVEGVSMLSSFRSQFADILATGDMGQLLQRLSAHNKSRG